MVRLRKTQPHVDPGLRRVRSGSGFRYVDPSGSPASEADRQRARSLAIPPAWQNVWICAEPAGRIQAVGVDDAGRMQYLYHPDWRSGRDRRKYERALDLASAMPTLRRWVTVRLRARHIDEEFVLAAALRLLDLAAPRLGTPRYGRLHGSRGLITLQHRDVTITGDRVQLDFPAKSGVRAVMEVVDAPLARALRRLVAGSGSGSSAATATSNVLAVPSADGPARPLSPAQVVRAIAEATGRPGFTAKDFRTLKGTVVAAQALARSEKPGTVREADRLEREAIAEAAAVLCNTPTVARSSYVDPRVLSRWRRGQSVDVQRSGDAALVALLRRGQPSRSKGARGR